MHLRQFGVWLAVESIRARVSERIGAPNASPRSPTSLPLALESALIEQAQQPFVAALQRAGEVADDISGAVFAIDGRLVAADLYGSNDLFRQMWPSLLRAHAIQSLMAPDGAATALPSPESVAAFLAPATRNAAQVRTVTSPDGWVHMAYTANAPVAVSGLERIVLKLLADRAGDADHAAALTRQKVLQRVLAAAETEGEDVQAATQQATRAGLFHAVGLEARARAAARASRPDASSAVSILPILAMLCIWTFGAYRMMAALRSAVARMRAAWRGRVQEAATSPMHPVIRLVPDRSSVGPTGPRLAYAHIR
jgi:hypothetical protein